MYALNLKEILQMAASDSWTNEVVLGRNRWMKDYMGISSEPTQ